MKILLTNDDGPYGPGLCELRRELAALGDVTVVCPAEERSGVGHAITYLVPVRARPGRLADGAPAHLLSGMPADCVKFALLVLMKSPPDLIVSGPNLGTNAGVDLFYSGTVAAAIEGGFYGVPSVAVSASRENEADMAAVAAQAMRVLRLLLGSGLAPGAVVNVNIPRLSEAEPEIRLTSQNAAPMLEEYVRFRAPRGRVYYFLDAAKGPDPARPGSDVAALEAGAISVTPLRRDLTDEAALPRLREALTAVRAKTYD